MRTKIAITAAILCIAFLVFTAEAKAVTCYTDGAGFTHCYGGNGKSTTCHTTSDGKHTTCY